MPQGKGKNTRQKILRIAAKRFSEIGFGNTTTSEIADALSVRPPTIYKYFPRKSDMLLALYRIYEEERRKVLPDLNELLKASETDPPLDVMRMMDYRFPEETAELVDQISSIATQCLPTDADTQKFVVENILVTAHEFIEPVVNRMVELGRIEPVDIEMFSGILEHYCYSAVARDRTPIQVDLASWKKGLDYLYTAFIKPTGK